MFKKTLIGAALVACCGSASAATVSYGWEDGTTTPILGSFGNVGSANVVSGGADGRPAAYEGSFMLEVTESPASGTPQAYVAWVTGLNDGDTVTASFWGYDTTPGASPSLRIWGHYATSSELLAGNSASFAGSAGGNSTYTDGLGWSQVSHTWTVSGADALVIEARLYSVADGDTYWIDALSVTAPNGAVIATPAPVPVPAAVWLMGSAIAGLAGYARRR